MPARLMSLFCHPDRRSEKHAEASNCCSSRAPVDHVPSSVRLLLGPFRCFLYTLVDKSGGQVPMGLDPFHFMRRVALQARSCNSQAFSRSLSSVDVPSTSRPARTCAGQREHARDSGTPLRSYCAPEEYTELTRFPSVRTCLRAQRAHRLRTSLTDHPLSCVRSSQRFPRGLHRHALDDPAVALSVP